MPSTLGRLGTTRTCATALLGALGVVGVAASATSCTSTANVSDVWMSLDEDGARHRNVFFTDTKAIYCIAEIAIGRNNATLEMQLRRIQTYDFAKNGAVDVNIVSAHTEQKPAAAPDRQLVTLRVPRTTANADGQLVESDDAAFTPGRLQCEVLIDGQLLKTATFNIQFAPCPTDEIHPSTTCFGFYPLGQSCPRSGLTGSSQPTCKCGEKGWEC